MRPTSGGLGRHPFIIRSREKADTVRDLELHFYFALRAQRDIQVMSACPRPTSTFSFTDIRGHRNRRAAKLRRQAESFVGGKGLRDGVDVAHKVHRVTPHFEITK